jgi:hypothetical protein
MRGFAHHVAMQRSLILVLLGLVGLSTGCARYEYDITRPAELAAHIGSKAYTTFQRDLFEYRMRAAEDRLVVEIQNQTDDPIQLLGDRSSVVDPDGQSHPLRSQPIAPRSFVKLIIPPYRPVVRQEGPTFGIGVGTYGDRRHHPEGFEEIDSYDRQPQYMTVVEDNALYWDWKGEGQVRMMLTFERKEQMFTQEFVIRRVKMK